MNRTFFEKIRSILVPQLKVGGLEISHSSLKYLRVQGTRSVVQASLQIPPTLLEKGRIKEKEQLIAALKELHLQIAPLSTILNVILTIPSQGVYTQPFSVPLLSGKQLNEAIQLNLQMLSPGRIEESNYDWQEIKENTPKEHVDLFAAFANSPSMRAYEEALSAAGFKVIAIEFPALSLSRLLKDRWDSLEANTHYLVLYLNSEGVLLLILKNGNLFFTHFTPWYEILKEPSSSTLSFSAIEPFLAQELQRVTNFYLSQSGNSISKTILIAPMFNYEIASMAEKRFSLSVSNLSIPELPALSAPWFPALGAALRGLIPRSKDTFISLTEAGGSTEYYQEKTLSFMDLWRNIVVATLVFVFLSFLMVDIMFARAEQQLNADSLADYDLNRVTEFKDLRGEAASFNKLVQYAKFSKERENVWSPVLARLAVLSGSEITVDRIFADRSNVTLLLSGQAKDEVAAINFKTRLEHEPTIQAVVLPLSQIHPQPDKTVTFTLTITLKPNQK